MIPLALLPNDDGSRVKRDRMELLSALTAAPGFDRLYRTDIIEIPADHPVYAWGCAVEKCERVRKHGLKLCLGHLNEWKAAKAAGQSMAGFLETATPQRSNMGFDLGSCRICPDRPARSRTTGLCRRHGQRWLAHNGELDVSGPQDFERWLDAEAPCEGYGVCRVLVCPCLAESPLGLCLTHARRYREDGSQGEAKLPESWQRRLELTGRPVPVLYQDEAAFRRWCTAADPVYRFGVINLVGLPQLAKTEIQWGLYAHTQIKKRSAWDLSAIQGLANFVRRHRIPSLMELGDEGKFGQARRGLDTRFRMACYEINNGLSCIYYSPSDTKEAGFIETDHFGRRFPDAASRVDLTGVSQRWLRDMLWEQLAAMLRDPKCPRTRGPLDSMRRACIELSAFLEVDAPQHGHDPTLLREEHAQRFVADQRHRARHQMPSLGLFRKDGKPSTVTDSTHRLIFNYARKIFYAALETDETAKLGLDTAFITAIPTGARGPRRSRSPLSDELARALADEANLRQFAETYDPHDRGLRDAWETIVYTGRRSGEVLKLRLDCIGRYKTLPMLWHDQTKVGNYNEGIRIPEPLYLRLDERRRKTLIRFEHRHGRLPTMEERTRIALFPNNYRNPHEEESISHTFFTRGFKPWIESLALGHAVPHQARHTLATNLLRAGASLAQIRRYLGQVSDRMAEHYVKVAHSDLEDALHAVWVAGPGAPTPGELLSGDSKPLTREEAMALALDVSRRSTPAEGGFCTFQPVVQGGACPWKLDCENCDKFVLSGADLLYWRRKQEQWRSIAERAHDDATADYLHQVFEPTARAIAGLEKALAGLGLLDQALAMDLRRPQDYFQRVWSLNFRAADLASIHDDELDLDEEPPA